MNSTKESALGLFKIHITAWNLKDWSYFEERLLQRFPGRALDKLDGRAFLLLDIIQDNNEELILRKLKEYYGYLKELTKT